MKIDDELKGMFKMVLALKGMTKEKKQKKNTIKLPIYMFPEQKVYEELGFRFFKTDNSIMQEAMLPFGWEIQNGSEPDWYIIKDENGFNRGKYFYCASKKFTNAYMFLSTRYSPCCRYVDENRTTAEIYFGNESEILYDFGLVYFFSDFDAIQNLKAHIKREKLLKVAEKWADENYPLWRNYDAYWELPLTEAETQKAL